MSRGFINENLHDRCVKIVVAAVDVVKNEMNDEIDEKTTPVCCAPFKN